MEIILSKKFKKQAQKLVENRGNLKEKINTCIIDFSKNGKESKYYRKALKGNWLGYAELQVGGNIRIIVRIHDKDQRAVLEQIGTHSQLGL